MRHRTRLQVVITQTMALALDHLAAEREMPASAVARQILRAGLDRTIHSAEVQTKLLQAGIIGAEATVESRARS
jgi:hypothetical protein